MSPSQHYKQLIEKRTHGGLIFFMCLIYLIHFLSESYYIEIFLSAIILVVFLNSVRRADRKMALFSVFMFISGVIILYLKGEELNSFFKGIQVNIPILALMLLVPLISVPFRLGGYLKPIQTYLLKMYRHLNNFFLLTTIFIFLIGPILSLGVIKVLHDLIEDFEVKPEVLAKSYLGGYSTVVIWSPYHASVALVLYYLNVSISEYLPSAIGLALLFLLLLNGLFRIYTKKQIAYITINNHIEGTENIQKSSLSNLLIIVSLLMISILTVEYVTNMPMTFIVTSTAILFPLIWSVTKKKTETLREEFKTFCAALAKNSNNEVVLFISAGLLGSALKNTWIMQEFQSILNQIYDASYLFFMLAIIMIILVFTFIGVHQVVIVTALLIQMRPETMGTSSVVLALLFMLSWSISAVLSPVNPLNLIVSHIINRAGIISGAKYNGLYLFFMTIIGCLYIYVLHLFMDDVI